MIRETTSKYYDALNLYTSGGTSGGSGGGTGGSTGCERDSKNTKDNLHRMKFNSTTDYKNAKDGWFNNDLEIQVDILFGQQNEAISKVTKYFTKKQKDVKDLNWTNLNVEVVTWDPSIWGNAMIYSWLEDDGGGTTTNSVSWTSKYDDNNTVTLSSSYTIPKENYNLGQSIVEYCDNTDGDGFTYNAGGISFQVNQQ